MKLRKLYIVCEGDSWMETCTYTVRAKSKEEAISFVLDGRKIEDCQEITIDEILEDTNKDGILSSISFLY